MKTNTKVKNIIRENRGSTLLTVIVAIGFVTILTTIILGTSLTNYRMKAIDRRAKDDFYYTEKALNDIYTGLGQEISVIAANAYDAAFASVGLGKINDAGTYIDISTAQKAEVFYKKKYFADVKSWLDTNANPATFQKFIVDTSAVGKEAYVIGTDSYMVTVEDSMENVVTADEYSTDAVCIRIKDVNVVCTDTNKDYKGEIITDIMISIPMMGFFDENADVVDYALIANKGIEINGKLDILDGNVYAGLYKVDDSTSDGGLKINTGAVKFDGNYLVSKGNIIVGSDGETASLTVGSDRTTKPNIWFDSIITPERANEPIIDIDANAFALNDIELNADDTSAIFSGSYYGYDDGTLATDTSPMLIDKGKDHADNSAIIINGNHSKLDLGTPTRDLSTLMLMGKAYINAEGNEISTAEALALRTNQQLYLVPPDFLECANPVAGTKTDSDWGCSIPEDWFGFKYLKLDDSNKPIVKTIVTGSGENAVSYLFFTFNDLDYFDLSNSSSFRKLGGSAQNKARAAFVYEIIHGDDPNSPSVQPTQSQLKERISNSLANYDNFFLQECVINDTSSANIFSVNALANYSIDYSGVTASNRIGNANISPVSNTVASDRYSSYPQNLFRRYQWLCTMLIPNEDIPLSKEISAVPTTTPPAARQSRKIDETSAWKADSEYPYKYYVRTPDLSISGTADDTKIPTSSYGEFIYSTEDYSIPSNSTFRGFVISGGNINVGVGTKVYGTLIAKGKIVFAGNNEVKSDRALIQKRISKEVELAKVDGKYCTDYLISYLDDGTGHLLYGSITAEGAARKANDERTDYTEYIYYENWKKGGR